MGHALVALINISCHGCVCAIANHTIIWVCLGFVCLSTPRPFMPWVHGHHTWQGAHGGARNPAWDIRFYGNKTVVMAFKKNLTTAHILGVAVHLGVKMADTLSFTAKMDMVDFWVSGIVHHKSDRKSCVIPTADRNIGLMVMVFCILSLYSNSNLPIKNE